MLRVALLSRNLYRAHPRLALGRRHISWFANDSTPHSTPLSSATTSDNTILPLKEQMANRSLSNPKLQAEFYRELLASNMPQVVVSRYETTGVAHDHECTDLYITSLKSLGEHDKAARAEKALAAATQGQQKQLRPLQSPSGNSLFDGNVGSSSEPVYVIVEESNLAMLLKWLKWIIPMGFFTWGLYNSYVIVGEIGSAIKRASNSGEFPGGEFPGTSSDSKNLADSANGTKSTVKFSDVQGVDEARAELEEIVEFLKDPAKFTGLGGKLPKGVLLTGPPGTGKTLLARAVAGEAGVPFFFMSGSEFDEMYVGVGAKRVRELFASARAKAPAIVFIDELDAIGGKRNPKDQAYMRQTLNQLLVDLDGFSQSTGVIFIAATNFPEMLDKALTRPGRFDKIVHVDLPDVRGRIAILNHHIKKIEAGKDIDTSVLARGTSGFSGADLMNLVNQAAIHASQQKAVSVNMEHFEWAKDKILLGAARKSMVLTEETRKNTAFHEAGHAIMALYTPGATSLYKATILPRGDALGITFQLPEMDKYDQSQRELLARLDVCMGGKIAEEMLLGKNQVTAGCSSDLRTATSVARAMVTAYGMSPAIGPMQLEENWGDWSAATRRLAEQEIVRLLTESESRTRQLLRAHELELQRLAEGLIEYETLDKEEMERVVRGEPLSKPRLVTNPVVKSEDIKDRRAHAA
ncbi:hypothetical protein DV451_004191 [Geotrichum candidum]|uniref:AAA+ ATPase domain-containing protein n=1 Tax=Geotrichum candidum TaxID=1173061 RepID=A0A9P5KQ38_GEOCN|nr:hypothetical protein DV451_004191 [Geotrichum candidum]KAF5107012.1 hypothetical protein DV453_003405 [Geotrichum candidum]